MPTETIGSETAEISTQTAFFLPMPVGLKRALARQPIKKGPFRAPFTTGVESSDIGAAGFEPTTPTTPK